MTESILHKVMRLEFYLKQHLRKYFPTTHLNQHQIMSPCIQNHISYLYLIANSNRL
ncbi:hypothetical protein NC651_000629 [Populus alba x Populus x berolinensis]|nr:hypothetical protein NC651_000629 [Populus alba x Populus x berolinensis]